MPVLTPAEIQAMDVWSRAEPRSLINLVPPAVSESLILSAQKREDLFSLDERSLFKLLKQDELTPTATDNRIRLAFWNEYDRAQANQKKMEMVAVFAGVCSKDYFYGRYLKHAEKVAWMVCPPSSYQVIAEEALAFGLEQLRDILSLSVVLPNGRADVKLGELQAKIVAMLDTRVKGTITQRLETKNMSLNISTSDTAVAKAAMAGTMDDIDLRLKELELRERRAYHLPVEGIGTGGTEAAHGGDEEAIEGEIVSSNES